MKKILLASACLLALTACSMPKQTKHENKPNQSQSQSKPKKEEKVKTKTFATTCLTDTIIKLSLIIKKIRFEPSILWLRNQLKRTNKVRVLKKSATLSRRIKSW